MNLSSIGMSPDEFNLYRPVMDAYGGETVGTNSDYQQQNARWTDEYTPSNPNSTAIQIYNSRARVLPLDAAGIPNGQFQYGASSGNVTTSNGGGISGANSGFTAGSTPSPDGDVVFLQGNGQAQIKVANLEPGVLYTLSMRVAQRAGNNQDLRIYVDGQDLGTIHPKSSDYYDHVTTQAFQVASAGAHVVRIVGLDTAGGDNTAFVSGVTVNEAAPQVYLGDFGNTGLPFGSFTYSFARGSFTSGNGGGVATNSSGFLSGQSAPTNNGTAGFVQGNGYLSWSVNGSTSNAQYRLAFSAAQRAGSPAQDISVKVDGTEIGRFTPAGNWDTFRTLSFDLNPGAHQITISGLDSGGGDRTALIDAVRVETLSASLADGDGHTAGLAPGTYAYSPAAAWTFGAGGGVATNNAGFTADGGARSDTGFQLFLQGYGSATQTIEHVQGGAAHTLLTFSARQRAGNHQSVAVYLDGVLVQTVTPKGTDYEAHQIDLGTMSKGAHQLSFRGFNSQGGDNSAMLTDIVVTQDGYANQSAFTHDAFSDAAIAAVVPNLTGSTLSNYISRALEVAPDSAQTLSLYTDYRQLSATDAATLYQSASGMLLGEQVSVLTAAQVNEIWSNLGDGSNEQALFLMQLDAYAPGLSGAIRQAPEPPAGPNQAIVHVDQVEAAGDYSAAATAAQVASLNAWMRDSAAASVGAGGATTITNSPGVTPIIDATQPAAGGAAPASATPSFDYGINTSSAAPNASGQLPVDAYAPLDSAGNPILRDAAGSGWDPYTQSYDIASGSTLMADGSIVHSGSSLPEIGRVHSRDSALPWYMGLMSTNDVNLASGGDPNAVTSNQKALRAGLWNSLQRQMLGRWLKGHAPGTPNRYTPPGTYCTAYVENVYKLATGFDLKEAVLADMVNGAPAPLDHLRGTTASNGYRYSSIFNFGADFAGADAYNSDNLQNFFERQGWLENAPDIGTGGYNTGDVIFLAGADGSIDHTAMISAVDGNGNPTQIAESTGIDVVYRSWNDFVSKASQTGLTIVSKGTVNFPTPPGLHFA